MCFFCVYFFILRFCCKHSICVSSEACTKSLMFFFCFSNSNSERKAEGKLQYSCLTTHQAPPTSQERVAWKITGLYHFRPRGGFNNSGLNTSASFPLLFDTLLYLVTQEFLFFISVIKLILEVLNINVKEKRKIHMYM